jgi:Na+/H+-dicarboxylate symporter
MKRIKMPLLARIIIAILLGVIFGNFINEAAVRAFLTFNGIFSQFLGFMIPLIIIGLVTPAIADIGHGAGKLLLATVGIAFADTILAGLLAYGTGSALFPHMIANSAHVAVDKAEELKPFFEIKIPAMVDVMSALVFSFIAGLGIAHKGSRTMQNVFQEFKEIVSGVIAKVIIPLLPLYIFGIFLGMTFSGEAYHILLVFAQIILVILVLHIVILLYEYLLAGGLSHKNPFKLLLNMLPAYFTALGTSSSAATIPVTLKQTLKNGVTDGIAGFTIPLCATIHLSGSMMKITCCALTICLINGMPCNLPLFLNFIFVLAICIRLLQLSHSSPSATAFDSFSYRIRLLQPLHSTPSANAARKLTGADVTNEEIIDAANKMLVEIPDEKKKRLLQLKKAGYRLFLLSNTIDIHWDYCVEHLFPYQNHGVEDYFEHCFLSQRMHLAKPDARIYEEVVKQANINPDETLFIDDLKENCEAAEKLGIHTFQNVKFDDWLSLRF